MKPRPMVDPTSDLLRHIIEGGDPETEQIVGAIPLLKAARDEYAQHDDPTQFGGRPNNFEGQGADAIREANAAQSRNLGGDNGLGTPIPMEEMNIDSATQGNTAFGYKPPSATTADRNTDGR